MFAKNEQRWPQDLKACKEVRVSSQLSSVQKWGISKPTVQTTKVRDGWRCHKGRRRRGKCPHTQANVSVHKMTNRKTLIDNGVHVRATKGSATDPHPICETWRRQCHDFVFICFPASGPGWLITGIIHGKIDSGMNNSYWDFCRILEHTNLITLKACFLAAFLFFVTILYFLFVWNYVTIFICHCALTWSYLRFLFLQN